MALSARLLLVLLLVAPLTAQAGSFRVIPVRLFLGAGAKTAVLRVLNEGDEKITIQVSAKTWEQDASGIDHYGDTRDIIYFPRIFTMEPEAEQTLRIGLNNARDVDSEVTYRIFLEELPVTAPGQSVLKFALRMGVPVFIQPADDEETWSLANVAIDYGIAHVDVRNTGNRHVVVNKVTAKGLDAGGATLYEEESGGWYVLDGRTRPFGVKLSKEACLNTRQLAMTVQVRNDTQSLTADVAPTPAQCEPPKEQEHRDGEGPEGQADQTQQR